VPTQFKMLSRLFARILFIPLLIFVALLASAQEDDMNMGDYGDAPDGHPAQYEHANAEQTGRFPAQFDDELIDQEFHFIVHRFPLERVFLGPSVTLEEDSMQVDEDIDDVFEFGDSALYSDAMPLRTIQACEETQFDLWITVPDEAVEGPIYLNMLFDFNHDGEWEGQSSCPPDPDGERENDDAAEWAVQNLELHKEPYNLKPGFKGTIRVPAFLSGPDVGEMWMRVTIATEPVNENRFVPVRLGGLGWDGTGDFIYGETEDYFLCASVGSTTTDNCPRVVEEEFPIDPTPVACSITNHMPRADDHFESTGAGKPVTFGVLATDPDGDSLRYRVIVPPSNGSAFGFGENWTYEPDKGFLGIDSFIMEATDNRCGTVRFEVFITVGNNPPEANDQSLTVEEDTELPITLTGSDDDGDILTCRLVTPPAHGTVVVNSDCSAEYTPDPDYVGDDSFEFEVDDGKGGTDIGLVEITMNPVNDPPVAVNDMEVVSNEDTDAVIDILDNDFDVDGDDLTIVNATAPDQGGSIIVNSDGTVTYTPPTNFAGIETFEYTICDPDNECDTALVTIEVVAINDPPVANDDSETTNEDTPVLIDYINNDTDVDGNVDPATLNITTDPANGSVIDNGDGTVTYTPDPDFNGTDTFTYIVCDDGTPLPSECSNEATVTVTIDPVNDAPVLTLIPDESVDEDSTLTVNVNCTDVDGDLLILTAANLPAGAGFVDNGDGTGEISYTPDFDVVIHGDTSTLFSNVEITCEDAALTDTDLFDITVNDVNRPPNAINDSSTTDEDTPVTINVVPDNDSDPDSEDNVSIDSFTPPSNGSVTCTATSCEYTPDPDFFGSDSFTYTICDDVVANQLCDTATVNVTISPINDPPVANPDSDTTDEDTPVSIDVLINDSDVDMDTLTVVNSTNGSNGTVDCSSGTECIYTPNQNFFGTDEFTYTVSDGNGGFDSTTVTVTINPINDPPVGNNTSRSMRENTAGDPNQLDINLLPVSDVDPDDTVGLDTLNCALSGAGPTNGNVVFGADCDITYTPDLNYVGNDSFDYEVCDDEGLCDTGTVTININNDAPIADPQSLSTPEETPINLTLTGSDPNFDPIDFSIDSGVSNGTLDCPGLPSNTDCTYTPDLNFNGTDSFVFRVTDTHGGFDTATVTIDVTPVPDPPTAFDDSYITDEDVNVPVILTATDPDPGDTLSYSIISGPSDGNIICSGLPLDPNCIYDPNQDFFGTDSFVFEVCDTQPVCDTATIDITINPVDDPPVLTTIPNETLPEDTLLTVNLVCTDVEGDSITLTATNRPAGSNFVDNGNGTGTITYTPGFDEVIHPATSELFSNVNVTCSANGEQDVELFDITVTDVNRVPTATNNSDTTDEDTPVVITVLPDDSDPDSEDTLYVNSVSNPPNGSASINPDGTITYTPDADYDGPTDTFTYEICDGAPGELCDSATVTVTINPVNDPPVAQNDSGTTPEDTPITTTVLNNDSDIDGNLVAGSVNVTSNPSNGSTIVNGDGSIQYTPDADFFGVDTYSYEVCDDGTPLPSLCDTATVTITVTAVNDAPVLATIPNQTTAEGDTLGFDVSCTDVDNPNVQLTVSNLPLGVSFVDNGDGTATFGYTPNFNVVSHPASPPTTDTVLSGINVTCRDGSATDSQSFSITVQDTNRPPSANNQTLTLNEDTQIALTLSSSDPDGDTRTYSINMQPSNGTLNCPSIPNCTYIPDPDYNGPDTFTFDVDDGFGGITTGTVTINVNPRPDPPEALNDSGTMDEDDGNIVISVLSNDDDPDDDSLSIVGFTQPNGGSVSCTAINCTYTPNSNFNGTSNFTYTITDGEGNFDTATVTVTVNPVNDPPTAGAFSTSVIESYPTPTPVSIDLPASDLDGHSITCEITGGPVNGDLSPTGLTDCQGLYTYTPDVAFVGVDSFTYEVCDIFSVCASNTVTINVINLDPTANPQNIETEEDVVLPLEISGSDPNNDPITFELIMGTGPTHGILSCPNLPSDGDCTYTPNLDYFGPDSFQFRVIDQHGVEDTATVNITVNPVNDPPEAEDDAVATTEDTPVNVTLMVSDAENDTLTCTSAAPAPGHGDVVINSDCTATYTPDENFVGQDTFAYRVSDGNGGFALALVSITISAENDLPVLGAISGQLVLEGELLLVGVTCTDVETASPILTASNLPPGATFMDNGDGTGTLSFTPDFNVVLHPASPPASDVDFSGIEITCDDGTAQVMESFTITVQDQNRAPTAANDDYSTEQDVVLNVPAGTGVLINDSDADGDTFTITAFDATSAQGGSVTVNADGSFSYTPPASYIGSDSFTYTLEDNFGGSNTATVSLTVTDPLAVNDTPTADPQSVSTPKNVGLGITLSGSDPNSDPITYSITSGVSNGTLDCPGLPNDPACTYTPDTDYVGPDSFIFEVCDDDTPQNCDTASVNITVFNQPPTAVADSVSTDEDMSVVIDVRANDSDLDGDNLELPTVSDDVDNGTTVVNGDGTITYTPNADFFGTDSFTYQVCDDDPVDPQCSFATVTITVSAILDAPVITVIGMQTASESFTLMFSVECTDVDTASSMLVLSASNLPDDMIFVDQGDGTGIFEYLPQFDVVTHPDLSTLFSNIQLDCFDGTTLVSEFFDLQVNDTNRPPEPNDVTLDVNEDKSVPIVLSGSDLDGDAVNISLTGAGVSNGTLDCPSLPNCTYTPDPNFFGTDSFQFEVDDGVFGGSTIGTISINIIGVNDVPVATPQTLGPISEDTSTPLGFTLSGTDIDLDTLTFGVVSSSGGSFDCPGLPSDGSCTFTPSADFNGTATMTFEVDDGNGETDRADIDITVSAVNDSPTAGPVSGSTFQDTEVTVSLDVADVDISREGDTLSCDVVAPGANNGTAVFNGCTSVDYTPDFDFVGQDVFSYEVCDLAMDCATSTITIDVVNLEPTANPLSGFTNEDEALPMTLTGFDPDGDPLTCSLVTDATNGAAVVNANCSATYTPDPNYFGDDSFVFQVDDGHGGTDTATMSITINPQNDEPELAAISDQSIAEGDTLVVPITCTDIDSPSNNLVLQSANLPQGANFVSNGDGTGSITYTPGFTVVPHGASPPTTPEEFTALQISCADEASQIVTSFDLTVTDTNRNPVAGVDSYAVDEDDTLNVNAATGVLVNDSDPDGDTISITSFDATSVQGGSVSLNADGSFTYTPVADFNGADSFTYTIEEDFGGSATQTVNITVNSVNDEPVLTAIGNQSVDENSLLTINISCTDLESPALTLTSPNRPSGATLNDNGDGTGSISFTPDFDEVEHPATSETFSAVQVICDDGTDQVSETFDITVDDVNRAPVLVNDNYVTAEDTPLFINADDDGPMDPNVGPLFNDSDDDGDTLTIDLTTPPADTIDTPNGTVVIEANGTFPYTPDAEFSGTDSFSYRAVDGFGGSVTATVFISVTNVDDPPVLAAISDTSVNEDATRNVNVSCTDVDSGSLTLSVSNEPPGASFVDNGNGTGTLTYMPDFDVVVHPSTSQLFSTIQVTCSDGTTPVNQTFDLTVDDVNRDPDVGDDNFSTSQDTQLSRGPALGVLANDSDLDGDTLTVSGFDSITTAGGVVSMNADGSFLYTPPNGFTGLDTFTYTVTDGFGGVVVGNVSIDVN